MTDPAEGVAPLPPGPKETKKSPAPAFHAYALFVAAYCEAAEKLRAGVRNVVFPDGCFPPALPFVVGRLETGLSDLRSALAAKARSGWYHGRAFGGVRMSLLDRIVIDPEICHGKPSIRGLRYPVETILELLSSGMTTEEILTDYEDLEREDILAALELATKAGESPSCRPFPF